MYTSIRPSVGRLRAYRAELTGRYAEALRRRNAADAQRISEQRRRVTRAILIYEEWNPSPASEPVFTTASGR